jgi:Holliday junction DNA helicase RuvB
MNTTANGRTQAQSNGTAANNETAGMGSVYPRSWDAYIGQPIAKNQMIEACVSAQMEGIPLQHTLIASGVPGIGKTALALLAADAMKCSVRVVAQQIKATEARMIFSDLQDGDILIIEEIHQLVKNSKRDSEWLLHYLQDGCLIGPLGIEEVPKVTVIGTTTDAGLLPQPVLDRFGLQPTLVDYTRDEAALICAGFFKTIWGESKVSVPPPSVANAYEIADAASGNPRVMRHMAKSLHIKGMVNPDLFDGENYDLAPMLADRGFTPDGLSDMAQRYLLCLLETFRGQPAGESAIKQRMREPGGVTHVETLLERKGLVSFTKQGRLLTMAGVKRAKELRGA